MASGGSDALASLASYSDEPESPDAVLGQPIPSIAEPLAALKPSLLDVNWDQDGHGAHPAGAMRERLPDGRVRSFPHVDGNFPGFVFVSVGRAQGLGEAACEAIAAASAGLGPDSKLHTVFGDDRHISVSRTFALRRHQIEPLVNDLKLQLKSIPSFEIELSGCTMLANEDQTRSFVVVPLTTGSEKMRSIVRAVDRTLTRWQIEPYYSQQRFHTSVAWLAGVPDAEKLKSFEEPKKTTTARWMVKSVQAKIGARSYNFKLRGS